MSADCLREQPDAYVESSVPVKAQCSTVEACIGFEALERASMNPFENWIGRTWLAAKIVPGDLSVFTYGTIEIRLAPGSDTQILKAKRADALWPKGSVIYCRIFP